MKIEIKINFTGGEYVFTRFNGTIDDAKKYYIGKVFYFGAFDDRPETALEVVDMTNRR